MKIKTYAIMLSTVFPVTHLRKGEETKFVEEFLRGRGCRYCPNNAWCNEIVTDSCTIAPFKKRHTIRANYPLWKKRIEAVQRGEAVLSVRVWMGKPYRSKTAEIARLTAQDGVGIQKLAFDKGGIESPQVSGAAQQPTHLQLANNDGLCFIDWVDWFKGYDLSQPLAIIHFTNFRY